VLGDWLGAFVLLWWTRLAVSHHLTWFINSLAHWWGSQTYSKEHSAVDNYVLAMLTVGEGYHNFHHTFPSDYRNGVRWWHFDPTKWTIWGLSKVGLAGDLKRYDEVKIRRRLLLEDLEDRRLLLERLSEGAHRARTEIEQRAEALCERVQAQLTKLGQLVEQRRRLERDPNERHRLRDVRRELRALRQSLRRDWRSWNRLCEAVL
jgi:stearoyl-CoA desaturase (delta-9 desaturase)